VSWTPPDDLDPECLDLCTAINECVPGVVTVESCCGHGERPFAIWVHADSLDSLPPLLYFLDDCHTGLPGWSMTVYTDCGGGQAFLRIDGPAGAFEAADKIACHLRDELGRV